MKKKLLAIPYEIYKTKNMVKIFKIKKIFPPRKTILRKISFGMIPIITLAIFLAPISSGLTTKKAEAYNADPAIPFNSNVFAGSSLGQRNIGPTSVGFNISITTDSQGKDWYQTDFFDCADPTSITDNCSNWKFRSKSIGVVIFKNGVVVSGEDLSDDLYTYFKRKWDPNWAVWNHPEQLYGNISGLMNVKLLELTGFQGARDITVGLDPETEYTAELYFRSNNAGVNGSGAKELSVLDPSAGKRYYKIGNTLSFTTLKANEKIQGDTNATEDKVSTVLNLGCYLGEDFKLSGCIAEFFLIVWEVSAKIMELAGKLLDFFMSYSLNSSAYTSAFIQEGWGVIRDVANIFFILVLLYIAIKTVLNLNVSNNKRLIGAVVIIALVINFSLFFTQVVIDSSNILAKVFYNQITSIDSSGSVSQSGSGGEKTIAVKLVSGFNPQSIIKTNDDLESIGRGMYIFIILIMIALTLYCAYMFFVVSILFIGRVVALWIAMIFSPFAFLSYAVPSDKIPFNHKQWWKDLLENAFMAPIFIFFLYIIILFIKLGKDAAISYGTNNSPDTMMKIMSVIIPFALIFLMLTKAKKLAQDFSGELGQMLSKVGGMATSFVGGGVVGFAAGALAKGGRATVGRAGSALANSQWATKMASSKNALAKFTGNKLISGGQAAAKGSFDIRGSTLGALAAQKSGLKVGKAKQGGFEAAKAEQKAKRDARAAHLKEVSSKPEKAKQHKSEMDRADLANKMKADLDPLEKTIERLTQELSQKSQGLGKDHPETKKAYLQLEQAKDEQKHIKEGKDYDHKGEITGVKTVTKVRRDPATGQMMTKDITDPLTGKVTRTILSDEVTEAVYDTSKAKPKNKTDYSKYSLGNAKATAEDIKNGKKADKDGNLLDENGKIQKRTIKYLDTVEIKNNAKAVFDKEAATLKGYASGMDSKLSKTFNFIFSGGEHSGKGAEETKMNIEKMARRLEESGKVK